MHIPLYPIVMAGSGRTVMNRRERPVHCSSCLMMVAIGSLLAGTVAASSLAQDTALLAPISLKDRYLDPAGAARASFVWSIADRFGLDKNEDGRIDLPNTVAYAQPSKFTVTFDATSTVLPRPTGAQLAGQIYRTVLEARHRAVQYEWKISGGSLAQPLNREGGWDDARQWSAELPQGVFHVDLTVHFGEWVGTVRAILEVKDILIVSIGDSYSSGEGNPESSSIRQVSGGEIVQRVFWADDGASPRSNPSYAEYHVKMPGAASPPFSLEIHFADPVSLDHIRAHRSTLSWPAQVALAIERADPHTSVTFISVAASGASVEHGLLGPFKGVPLPFSTEHFDPMPPQIDQVASLVGSRRIDVMLVSVGINDIGFRYVLSALALHGYTGVNISYNVIQIAVHSGDWGWLNFLEGWVVALKEFASFGSEDVAKWGTTSGLDQLPSLFTALSDAIHTRLSVHQTIIAEYADPTGKFDDNGNLVYCPHMLNDVTAPTHIDGSEAQWGFENVLIPLNRAIRDAAISHGWRYVSNIANRFGNGHGICADPPYDRDNYLPNAWNVQPWPTADRVAWFRPAKGSAAIEGPFFSYGLTQGSMHPNEFGHQAVKEAVLANIVLPRTTELWLSGPVEFRAPVEAAGAVVRKYIAPHN